MPKIPSVYQQN